MASVALRFIPPNAHDLVRLHIWESATKAGVFNEIDSTTVIGSAPNWIDHYTTNDATAVNYWFAIQWEDVNGAFSDLSVPMQGNSQSLVGLIVDRMMLRDPTLNEIVASEEAEAAVSDYFGVMDPFTVDPATVSPKILSGLTNLSLARTYITKTITGAGTSSKWVAGIVSMDSSSSSGSATNAETVKALIELANHDLGRNYSVILLLEEISVAGGMKQLQGVDLSRLIYEIQ